MNVTDRKKQIIYSGFMQLDFALLASEKKTIDRLKTLSFYSNPKVSSIQTRSQDSSHGRHKTGYRPFVASS